MHLVTLKKIHVFPEEKISLQLPKNFLELGFINLSYKHNTICFTCGAVNYMPPSLLYSDKCIFYLSVMFSLPLLIFCSKPSTSEILDLLRVCKNGEISWELLVFHEVLKSYYLLLLTFLLMTYKSCNNKNGQSIYLTYFLATQCSWNFGFMGD